MSKLLYKIKTVITGEYLSDIRIGKYLPHFFYIVIFTSIYVIIGIVIDATLIQVEENKQTIEKLRIEKSVKTHTYSSQRKLENIEKNLNEKNIEIKFPTKPANRVD